LQAAPFRQAPRAKKEQAPFPRCNFFVLWLDTPPPLVRGSCKNLQASPLRQAPRAKWMHAGLDFERRAGWAADAVAMKNFRWCFAIQVFMLKNNSKITVFTEP
jgi:hypothetical protein